MTTLRQLAEHLGLSPATVSRALNGFPEVGERTRRRVLEGAEALHYRPNMHAKRLATGRSGLVGMIFRAPSERGVDPHVMDFLSSLSLAFADSEIDLVVHIAPPAAQMKTSIPSLSARSAISRTRSGLRCAEATLKTKGIPRSVRTFLVGSR